MAGRGVNSTVVARRMPYRPALQGSVKPTDEVAIEPYCIEALYDLVLGGLISGVDTTAPGAVLGIMLLGGMIK